MKISIHQILLFYCLIYFSDLSGQDTIYVSYSKSYSWFSEKAGLTEAIKISTEAYQDSFFQLREELIKYAGGCGTGMEEIVTGNDTLSQWYTNLENKFNKLTSSFTMDLKLLQESYKPGIEKLITEAEQMYFEEEGKHVLFYKSASHAFDKTDYFIEFLNQND